MSALDSLSRFFSRFRYPFTLPEDIANALGINVSNYVTFDEFMKLLTSPSCNPTKLTKFMPRKKAEGAFKGAQRKEQFTKNTLISYYFPEGWVEFNLEFDGNSELRRVYIQHKQISEERGIELHLAAHS